MSEAAPIIVSIATIPSRIGAMKPTLDSLLAGDVAPDLILVNTPRFCKLENTGYDIPAFLTDSSVFDGRVRHVVSEVDWGPGTKMLGALPHLPATCILVIADDDILYHREFLKRLVEAQTADHDRAYSYFVYRAFGMSVGQGCDGLSVWSSHLHGMRAFVDSHVAGTSLIYHDDIWIAFFLMTKGVKITSIPVPAGADLVYQQVLPNTVLAVQTGKLKREQILATHLPRLLTEVALPGDLRRRLAVRKTMDRTIDVFRRARRKLRKAISLTSR